MSEQLRSGRQVDRGIDEEFCYFNFRVTPALAKTIERRRCGTYFGNNRRAVETRNATRCRIGCRVLRSQVDKTVLAERKACVGTDSRTRAVAFRILTRLCRQ